MPPGFKYITRLLARLTAKKDGWYIPIELEKILKNYYTEDNYLIDRRYKLGLKRDHYDKYF